MSAKTGSTGPVKLGSPDINIEKCAVKKRMSSFYVAIARMKQNSWIRPFLSLPIRMMKRMKISEDFGVDVKKEVERLCRRPEGSNAIVGVQHINRASGVGLRSCSLERLQKSAHQQHPRMLVPFDAGNMEESSEHWTCHKLQE
eukprot:gene17334-biopygen14907